MAGLRPDIPPHVAEFIRHLHPDLKRRVKTAIRTLRQQPELGEPLKKELQGLWKGRQLRGTAPRSPAPSGRRNQQKVFGYRVRRFRIVYAVDRPGRALRVLAVGHRQRVYEEVVERIRQPGARK